MFQKLIKIFSLRYHKAYYKYKEGGTICADLYQIMHHLEHLNHKLEFNTASGKIIITLLTKFNSNSPIMRNLC